MPTSAAWPSARSSTPASRSRPWSPAPAREAEAAAELVRVDYEPLPHVLDGEESLAPDAPRLYEEWPDNVILHNHYGAGDVDAALASADLVVSDTIRIARSTTAPIEPRGYLASWDRLDETLTVYGSLQNPHQLRWMISRSLGLDETAIHVITARVGGSFGLKMQGHPEETLICLLSKLDRRAGEVGRGPPRGFHGRSAGAGAPVHGRRHARRPDRGPS